MQQKEQKRQNQCDLFIKLVKTSFCASSVCQINWSLGKQELLFSDFCEDSDNIEEGAEYNKVL